MREVIYGRQLMGILRRKVLQSLREDSAKAGLNRKSRKSRGRRILARAMRQWLNVF